MAELTTLSPDVLICGTTMRLLALETTKSKWSTTLVGSKPGRYLIVEMPKVAGAPAKLDDGTRWAVNFISKGAVYSFNTEVLGYTYRLVPLLFLAYPAKVEIANLRTDKRYPVNIPIVFKAIALPAPDTEEEGAQPPEEQAPPQAPPSPLKGLIADISESGFMMASPEPLLPETTIEGTLYLPKNEQLTGIQAVVRTCRGKAGGYFIGLAYSQRNTPEVVSLIGKLISNIENMPLRL